MKAAAAVASPTSNMVAHFHHCRGVAEHDYGEEIGKLKAPCSSSSNKRKQLLPTQHVGDSDSDCYGSGWSSDGDGDGIDITV